MVFLALSNTYNQRYVDVQATMWGEAAKDSYYPINIPDYASNILGPRRTFYINKNRANRELLASNVKVRRAYYTILSHKFKDKRE